MKMTTRHILIGAAVAAGLLFTASCGEKVIDIGPTGNYDESVAYASEKNFDLYVKSLYAILYANADIAQGYISDDSLTDLVKQSWYGVGGGAVNHMFYDDNYITPQADFRSKWGFYSYIRQINEVFFDYSYGYMKGLDDGIVKSRLAEARFLRAFAYQELTLRYGGVILRVDEDHVDGPEERVKARSSEEDCWKFVIGEYDKAAQDLPETWSGADLGRITKDIATAMKARAALYAKDWQLAFDTADEVIKSGKYALMDGSTPEAYNKIFTNVRNTEVILPVFYRQSTGGASSYQHYYNQYFCPPYDGNSYGVSVGAAATPTDEYASMFDIKVGAAWQKFSWDNLASYPDGPFANRDPRFYASILYNGAPWRGRNLELYVGGVDGYMDFKRSGQDNDHRSTTGYIFRKFLSEDAMNYSSILSGQDWIEMRLAELYFIRSEAAARLYDFNTAYDDLNTIRSRVGLEDLGKRGNWDGYLEDLAKEKVCEMGLEGHRYHDIIRWGIAQKVLDGTKVHGIKITKNTDGTFNYERVEAEDGQTRHFPERYNIFPIPYSEMQNNKACTQNDAWL